MEIIRWVALVSDLAVAAVLVLLAESIGDIAYVIAAIVTIAGLTFFGLWPRIFR
jgi:hypothetical protein